MRDRSATRIELRITDSRTDEKAT